MIGAGGLMYLLEAGYDIPGRIGLAGFNGVNLLKGLPKELATMDACRLETGRRAAQIIASRVEGKQTDPVSETMEPKITYGDTLRRP
jgi:LacI family gluconate utilization system Gnt-I transcriptional repressor